MIESIKLSNLLFQQKVEDMCENIMLSNHAAEIMEKHLSQQPFHLNVIEAACRGRFKETGHSRVLADMLRHRYIQASFLEFFLGIQHKFMEVTAETDRVDVALRGEDMFVIIENKVNDAEEQENQVYRYVHDIGIAKYGFALSQIYVVYLNPTNRNPPSDYSLCDENGENNVFEDLGTEHYTVQSYKYDITDWLRGLSIDNEPHISSALDQYIDFLENKFHTSKIFTDMNNEIKDLILKELHIEGKSIEEQITALDAQRDKVNELLNAIDQLKVEFTKKQSHDMMLKWQNQIEQQLDIRLEHEDHYFRIQLNNKVWLGVWDGHDNTNYLPYWGLQVNPENKEDIPDFDSQLLDLLELAGIKEKKNNKYFYAWCSTQKGAERFVSLYQAAKSLGLL